MADFDWDVFTAGLIDELRTNDGVIASGPMAGKTLLILTTTGAKSGKRRTAVLTYTRDGDRQVVAGSAGGSPKDPAWLHNIKANEIVTVEAGGETFQARAKEASDRAEHDRLWAQHVAALPEFAGYPEQSGRVIPMVTLARLA